MKKIVLYIAILMGSTAALNALADVGNVTWQWTSPSNVNVAVGAAGGQGVYTSCQKQSPTSYPKGNSAFSYTTQSLINDGATSMDYCVYFNGTTSGCHFVLTLGKKQTWQSQTVTVAYPNAQSSASATTDGNAVLSAHAIGQGVTCLISN